MTLKFEIFWLGFFLVVVTTFTHNLVQDISMATYAYYPLMALRHVSEDAIKSTYQRMHEKV